MPIRGDFGQLSTIKQRVAGMKGSAFRTELAKALAEESRTQVVRSFERSVDPYDRPWKKLTSRSGTPLRDTGAHFLNSFTIVAAPRHFGVMTNFIGANVHQYGATIKPKNKKALRFKVRGRATKSNPRGKLSGDIIVGSVKIPKRQVLPEGDAGPRWNKALEAAADSVIAHHLEGK